MQSLSALSNIQASIHLKSDSSHPRALARGKQHLHCTQRSFAMEDLALAKLLTKARLELETALEVRFVLHQHGNHSNLELFPMSLQERCCTNCCKCMLHC